MKKNNLINYVESHEREPLVRKVLTRYSSFKKEVKSFYGLETFVEHIPRVGSISKVKMRNYDSRKNGKCPTDLVKILEPFGKESLDLGKLQYDSVIKDYQRNESFLPSLKRNSVRLGGLCLSVSGIYGFIGAIAGSYFDFIEIGTSLALGAGSLATIIPGWKSLGYNPIPKGTNYEFDEFKKLEKNAEEADWFMEYYREYLVQRALDSN